MVGARSTKIFVCLDESEISGREQYLQENETELLWVYLYPINLNEMRACA